MDKREYLTIGLSTEEVSTGKVFLAGVGGMQNLFLKN